MLPGDLWRRSSKIKTRRLSKVLLRVKHTPMTRRGERLSWLLLVFLAGCYWQKYPKLVRTHTEVLTAMASKTEDVLRDRGGYRPRDLSEFRYPYDRARDFARIVRDRFRGRSSFRRFEELLDRYAALLATVDRLNAGNTPNPGDLARPIREVHQAAREALTALEEE